MTTDPTADAIAALARAESLADSEGFEDSAAYFREVRSALLSAQGQAGMPVATAEMATAALKAWEASHHLRYGAMLDALNAALALYVQPEPASFSCRLDALPHREG